MDLQSGLPISDEMWGVMGKGSGERRPPPTNDYHSIGNGFYLLYKGHPYFDNMSILLTIYKGTVHLPSTNNNLRNYGIALSYM